ncbi:NPCBM/NEW2 domain-containing protein [Pedosphaera parvula]|nr:NPCBM/NEW2 domain-containing protein [Pedosphaera parvula]
MSYWNVKLRVLLGICAGLLGVQSAQALTNGLALTPPMGYNTWYARGSSINEDYIKSIADTMATNGMKAAGYEYVNMDDGWAGYRDTNGVMIANTNKFPSGIKALADYVHGKGLKLGLYTVFGPTTCAHLPGSYGHEVQDAQTYAQWGIDYLKYEGCSFPDPLAHETEKAVQMRDALAATGRPIVFTMSTGPAESWMPDVLNMWRGAGDNVPHGWNTFLRHMDFVAQTPELAGPGHWNDPDVMDLGFGGTEQDKAILTMYCIVAAPLLSPTVSSGYLNILTNAEALQVNQDPAGIQGACVATNGDLQVWSKPLSEGVNVRAVALLNRGTNTADITANWGDLGFPAGVAKVRDLWARAYEGNFTNSFTATVPGQSVKFLKIAWGSTLNPPVAGTNYLSDLNWLAGTTWTVFPPGIQMDKSGATQPMSMHGIHYSKGLGTIAYTRAEYFLGGVATRFQATVGVDDVAGGVLGSVVFRVYADGIKIYDSGLMRNSSALQLIDVDITGRQRLVLEVNDGGDGNVNDYGDWANALITALPQPPAAPVGLATISTGNQVSLTWYAIPGATSYTVKRSSTSGGPYQVVGTSTNSSFADINSSGSTYYYVVSAANLYGQSTNSLEAAAVPPSYWANTITAAPQNWEATPNWTNTISFPNNLYVEAVINANIVSNQTINVNQPISIGSLTLGGTDASASYTIAGNGGTLTFNNGSGVSVLTQLAGSKGDTLAVPITLNNQTTVRTLSSYPLNISAALSGGGALVKNGSGTLSLGGSNSFTGGLKIAQGTLLPGNAFALGSTAGGTIVDNFATLDLNGVDVGGEQVTVSGTGSGFAGAIVDNNTNGSPGRLQAVTLGANATFGGQNNWSIRGTNGSAPSGSLSTGGMAYNLTKMGTNLVWLSSIDVDSSLGDIDIEQGFLGFEGATTSMGNPARTLTVKPGASLVFNQTTTPWNKVIVLNGDGLNQTLGGNGGSNTIAGPITLNGSCRIDVSAGSLTFAGLLGGNGTLRKNLTGTLYLSATNNFTGDTLVNAGVLAVKDGGSIASKNIVINSGATLDGTSANQGEITLGDGQTLGGQGTIKGNLTLAAGATLLSSIGNGTPVFNNSLILGAGSKCAFEWSKPPITNSLVQAASLTYGGQLALTSLTSNSPVIGDVFKLFNASSYAGAFQTISPQIPGPGMLWDTTGLTTDGTIRIIAGTLPHIDSFSMTGNSLRISGLDGKPNAPYHVLASTNSALPLYQWIRISTNTFDAAGHFSFTNLIDHAVPGMFFSLDLSLAESLPQLRLVSLPGNNLVLTAGGGPANASCTILASTNIALPLAQWTHIATNQLDAYGNFSLTNTISPGVTKRFYFLQIAR